LDVGKTVEARRKLEDLLSRDDTVGRVVELSIHCALAAGEHETAEDQSRNLAQMYSGEPHPYVVLSQVALLRGDAEEAVEFCNNALLLDPKYIPAIITRANLYTAQRQIEAARVSFEKLLLFEDPVLRAIGMEGIGFVEMLSGSFDDGVAAMDEAVRLAILAGSVRRGLFYAYRLVEYLCELGQGDAAAAVVNRWITGFGDIPVSLGKMRVDICEGKLDNARDVLTLVNSNGEWDRWMRVFAIDLDQINALVHIGAEEHEAALEILARNTGTGSVSMGTRTFLRGYASFENGDAEAAGLQFEKVGNYLYGVDFPYHGDPVLYVQSLYFLAETYTASGRESEAGAHYESFMEFWREADWDIQAIGRARDKIETSNEAVPAE
jgi:tetratricopeptide (TPR) repeat protein